MPFPKLIPIVESGTNRTVFVNPNKVVMIFRVDDGEFAGNTAINLVNNGFFTKMNELEAVGLINGALNE